MATTKRGMKRKAHLIGVKYDAILAVENGRKKAHVAKELGINASTLSTWLSQKDAIKAGYQDYGPKRKTMKPGKWEELEDALLKWLRYARDNETTVVSGPVMLDKANLFAAGLGIENFKATNGWLTRFKVRNRISFRSLNGKNDSINVDTRNDGTEKWTKRLESLVQVYGTDCIYCAAETGIFFKMLPDQTQEYESMECNGKGNSAERLTVLVCTNITGTDKLPLLVIGESSDPLSLDDVKTLPTKYTSNSKAWMTMDIFKTWLMNLDDIMTNQGQKIALIVESCLVHSVVSLKNVEVVLLPLDADCSLQPIIYDLRVNYRKQVVTRQVMSSKTDFEISVLDALRFLKSAWHCVSLTTIVNCSRSVGFKIKPTRSEATEEEEDVLDNFSISELVKQYNWTNLVEFIFYQEDLQTSVAVIDKYLTENVVSSQGSSIKTECEEAVEVTGGQHYSVDDALAALDVLQSFWESQTGSERQLGLVSKLNQKLVRHKLKTICNAT